MPVLRHQQIEHGILRMVFECTDHLGYPTDLSRLAMLFRSSFPDIGDRELVDTLKRLRLKKYLTLCKYLPGQPSCLEYPVQIADDEEFFYRNNGFRLRRTPETDPRAQELAALIEEQTSKPSKSTSMPFRPLKSFFPTADDLLAADLPRLGEVLLVHLSSYEDRVKQRGMFNRSNLLAMLEGRNVGLGTPSPQEYGTRQPQVIRAIEEAWNWLEREGMLIRAANQPADWFTTSRRAEELLSHFSRVEHLEALGVDHVKQAVVNGFFSSADSKEALEWLRIKESHAALPPTGRSKSGHGSTFIAESRINELRKLSSLDFDFQKLIRLCEELNSSYDNGNYYATAMLTRAVLDHVPPIFGKSTFAEVANNYGGHSFKATMQHLDKASRKVSDDHLHGQIRKKDTLPTPQQVSCTQQLDVLLAEIVRIVR